MKLFFVILAGFLSLGNLQAETMSVPGVGSEWELKLAYKNVTVNDRDSGTPEPRSRIETMEVVRMRSGVPVFRTEVWGKKGELTETATGTVVYIDACKDKVPEAVFEKPPLVPNQCGWNLCNPPPVGQTLSRSMVFYIEEGSCEPEKATYTFKSIEKVQRAEVGGQVVVVGEVTLEFGKHDLKDGWTSFVAPENKGQIYAESSAWTQTYSLVKVKDVPFVSTVSEQAYRSNIAQQLVTASLGIPVGILKNPISCPVVAFGDSLTFGTGAKSNESYPVVLSELIGYRVCKEGTPRVTTDDALRLKLMDDVIARKPKVVIVALGANDFLKGLPRDVTEQNLTTIVKTFRQEGIEVVVLGFEGVFTTSKEVVGRASSLRTAIERTGGLYLPKAFVGVLDQKSMVSSDGMHPNAAGYRKLAENIRDDAFGVLKAVPSLKTATSP